MESKQLTTEEQIIAEIQITKKKGCSRHWLLQKMRASGGSLIMVDRRAEIDRILGQLENSGQIFKKSLWFLTEGT